MDNLIVIGSGGHALASINVIESLKRYKIQGIVDNKDNIDLNYPLLGNDQDLPIIKEKYINAFIGVGQIREYKKKLEIFTNLKELNFNLPSILSQQAIYSNDLFIEEASIIMHGAVIGPKVKIGKNSIINSSSVLEHGVKIGSNTHISTSVTLNGDVDIGECTFIGSGTVVKEGVSIGSNCFIKMGSIISKNIENNEKV